MFGHSTCSTSLPQRPSNHWEQPQLQDVQQLILASGGLHAGRGLSLWINQKRGCGLIRPPETHRRKGYKLIHYVRKARRRFNHFATHRSQFYGSVVAQLPIGRDALYSGDHVQITDPVPENDIVSAKYARSHQSLIIRFFPYGCQHKPLLWLV